jgi:dTDP-4-dehydrorhamnose reductase
MRVYLTGADGMLGTALTSAAHDAGWLVHGVTIDDFDITDEAALRESMAGFDPDVVVHTAAHAIVDDCEADPRLAIRVNVYGVHNVARVCRENGPRLVYISSDYVFDGADPPDGGYRESDVPNPLSVYGLTKLAGERIAATVEDHLIVRTSWLFGGRHEHTDNVLSLIRRALRGERTQMIDDQFSCPTYTEDLAGALAFLLGAGLTGTINVVNHGRASWYDVARVALPAYDTALAARLPAEPTSLDECGFTGVRPRDSTLNGDLLARLGFAMPSWSNAVSRYCAGLHAADQVPVRLT